MPIQFLRELTSAERTAKNNIRLGVSLAFVAGAVNAGGFLAVGQYTSHMSGIVSALADNAVLGEAELVLLGLASLLCFISGAACSAMLINLGRRFETRSLYAAPLMLEATLLLCFGFLETRHGAGNAPLVVDLLCFMMGLQNAMITKISRAEIRTTHVTGLVTDIGIELGKLAYINSKQGNARHARVVADRTRMALLASLLSAFLTGALAGALGFKYFGFIASLPLVGILVLLAIVPVVDDIIGTNT